MGFLTAVIRKVLGRVSSLDTLETKGLGDVSTREKISRLVSGGCPFEITYTLETIVFSKLYSSASDTSFSNSVYNYEKTECPCLLMTG